MIRMVSMAGMRFGKLYVHARAPGPGRIKWICDCDCGNTKVILGENIRAGKSQSCGCGSIGNNFQHGYSHMPEYHAWFNMMSRCYNKTSESYRNYGGRGIRVCERWHVFENFLADMGYRPHPKLTLERVDNSGWYESANCCWNTRLVQNNNRRRYRSRRTEVAG